MVMGFKWMGDSPERFPVQPKGDLPQDDDGQDVDIDVAEMQAEGQEIPVGHIVVRADPDDEITVNGTKLKPTSTLAALRAGCAFYNLSSSGSKVKCFQRTAEYQKRLELEMVMAAAKDSQKESEREPHAPPTAEPPSELEQAKHRLTHLPYSNWCPSCLMHRALRHERTGEHFLWFLLHEGWWSLHLAGNTKETSVNMVSLFRAMWTREPTKQLHDGDERFFWGKLILKTALCFYTDSPLFFPRAFEESARPGGAILHITFTASVTHGNSNQVLVPGFCLSWQRPFLNLQVSKCHWRRLKAASYMTLKLKQWLSMQNRRQEAEEEQIAMSLNGPINVHAQVQQQQQAEEPTVFDDGQPVGDGVVLVHNPEAAGPVPLSDPGLAVPVTPPRDDVTLDSPRGSSTVRANNPGGAESEESKRAKVEESKTQRINRLQLEYEERLSAVRIAYKEYFTMDDYSTDLNVDDDLCENDEFWYGEDEVKLGDIQEALWSDAPTDVIPNHAPEAWIDDLADHVEIQRLWGMKVLVRADEYRGDVSGKLTTRFLRDWRLKPYWEKKTLRWMRRSRFVAREFVNEKILDTFNPATGAHTANLLPIQYLWQKQHAVEMENKGGYEVVMGCLDVKDAFLQVVQPNPIVVSLQNQPFVILRNLPGQRMGARQ